MCALFIFTSHNCSNFDAFAINHSCSFFFVSGNPLCRCFPTFVLRHFNCSSVGSSLLGAIFGVCVPHILFLFVSVIDHSPHYFILLCKICHVLISSLFRRSCANLGGELWWFPDHWWIGLLIVVFTVSHKLLTVNKTTSTPTAIFLWSHVWE